MLVIDDGKRIAVTDRALQVVGHKYKRKVSTGSKVDRKNENQMTPEEWEKFKEYKASMERDSFHDTNGFVSTSISAWCGCKKCSLGCVNCNAEGCGTRMTGVSTRGGKWGLTAYEFQSVVTNGQWNGTVCWRKDRYTDLLYRGLKGWPCRRRYSTLLNYMTDSFGEFVPRGWIDDLMVVIVMHPNDLYWVLTKRSKRMHEYFSDEGWKYRVAKRIRKHKLVGAPDFSLKNAWFGVSTEDQATFNRRAVDLMKTNVPNKYINMAPMIGNIDLSKGLKGIGLVSCSCETGVSARPMLWEWAVSAEAQCAKAGIPFHMAFHKWDKDGNLHRELKGSKGYGYYNGLNGFKPFGSAEKG